MQTNKYNYVRTYICIQARTHASIVHAYTKDSFKHTKTLIKTQTLIHMYIYA